MAFVRIEASGGLRFCVLTLAAVVAGVAVTNNVADARHHRRVLVHFARHLVRRSARVHRHSGGGGYSPPYSSIVIDANSGKVLQASNPDALRHPASLTKIMTLYLLFEELDAGKIKLDTPLRVSEHAAEQAPSKLGLKPGQTITVEDAIRAVVTKSANDVAVTIAENLGGSEEAFAKLMTRKARALGMSHTTYVNASGLPNDGQITTARDLALLGRTMEDRFPRYYRYFSTRYFVYHGDRMRNHDHLLGEVEGVDGIKTGYIRASGFNLVTSVHRDGHYLIAVVMGGHSASQRDAQMRDLIDEHIKEASLRRTAPVLADRTEPGRKTPHVAFARSPLPAAGEAKPAASKKAAATVGSTDPIRPFVVRTISYRTAPVHTASLASMPALVPVASPAPLAPPPAAPPSAVRPQPIARPAATAPVEVTASTEAMPRRAGPARAQRADAEPEPSKPHAHSGWLIQIGAFDGEAEAKQHLSAAQSKLHRVLAAADPFTERVQKGDKSFYRARFAGFDKATAEATCRQLRRNDIACLALKD